jgi:adenylate cyclase
MGDAFLVEFESALEATECAVEMQRVLHEQNADTPEKVLVKVGIHVGDVVHREGDVYGDAVNIASRIEPLAAGGEVCISQQVFDQVRNKLPFRMVKLEPRDLKNISVPIDVYKVELPWETATPESPKPNLPPDRIAVLPFTNISPDPNDEFFADGLTEELIASLSHIRGLKVIARTSVMNYKKKGKNVSEIGRELGVGTVVEGSVRRAANRVRVTVQVIDVNTEEHLWASNYDASLDDIFAVQSDVASKVASSLPGSLVGAKGLVERAKDTEDMTAYMFFLQGRELMFGRSAVQIRQALDFFERAVARDPKFARAYAGIAQCYVSLGESDVMPWQDAINGGKAAVKKALGLNRDLAEAHALLSHLAYMADDMGFSQAEARKAIDLNPNLDDAMLELSALLADQGQTDDWVRLLESAYQLNPLSPRVVETLGRAYFYLGRDARALAHWSKTLEISPFQTYRWMADYWMSKGDYVESAKAIGEMEKLQPLDQLTLAAKGFLAALKGDKAEANVLMSKLQEAYKDGANTSSFTGYILFAMSDIEGFFACMTKSAEQHTLPALNLLYSPLFAKVRDDPRFVELFAKVGMDLTLRGY